MQQVHNVKVNVKNAVIPTSDQITMAESPVSDIASPVVFAPT
jgi:hypothetical protein